MASIFARAALTSFTILGATFAVGVYAQAADTAQLAAAAGVSQEEAATMSLSELAAAKFNRDSAGDDRQSIADSRRITVDPVRHARLIAAVGLTPAEAEGLTLSQLAAGKVNADSDGEDARPVMSSRGPIRIGSQLASAAGLSAAEAQGMSLTDIAAAKFDRDTGDDD
jgi:hypothetical protein